jgi:hypothetical protein
VKRLGILALGPRVADLAAGDDIAFRGEYEWNERARTHPCRAPANATRPAAARPLIPTDGCGIRPA